MKSNVLILWAYWSCAVVLISAPSVRATTRYVDLNNPAPFPPYTSWSTAATTIQDAIDAAMDADEIVVTNGVYATGGRVVDGSLSNRVAVTKAVTVRSVNGPEVTTIQGYQVPGTTNGDSAVRCVFLGDHAALIGFTLTDGATKANSGSSFQLSDCIGGGVSCASISAVVSNCLLTGNSACYHGGGAYRGSLNNCTLVGNSGGYGGGAAESFLSHCTLTGNSAWLEGQGGSGGGAFQSTLQSCILATNSATYGGGACEGTLTNCILKGNSAVHGGGAFGATLHSCALVGNSAGMGGGGAYNGTLNNCTVIGNSAVFIAGGVSTSGGVSNCIIYHNSASAAPNGSGAGSSMSHCCTTPLPRGDGNFTNAPLFVNAAAGDFHLQPNSPCINAGHNVSVCSAFDLDDLPRIVGGTVDVGAYEYQTPASTLSYGWLQQYGLPVDGSADATDSDLDGMNTKSEWIAGTDPTNASSNLRLLSASATASGVSVSWTSASNRTYVLERAMDLGGSPSFTLLQSNLHSQADTTSFMDTNVADADSYFYRVRVAQ